MSTSFRKRKRRSSESARRPSSTSADPAPATDANIDALQLRRVRLIQRKRQRIKGIPSIAPEDVLAHTTAPDEEPKDKAPVRGGLVASSFTAKSEDVTSHEAILSAQKEAFIQQRLLAKRLDGTPQEHQPDPTPTTKTTTTTAPHIPDDQGESAERWLAGIAEVALPIDVRLANIERTERAKQAALVGKGATYSVRTGHKDVARLRQFKVHQQHLDQQR